MKRHIVLLSLLIVTLSLSAQSVLSFGARGGLDFMMPKSDLKTHTKVGYAGVFDIGYTYYWFTSIGEWGIHTGLSAGYAQNECQIDIYDQFTCYDFDGYQGLHIDYTIEGNMNSMLQRAYGEVPLMAAFQKNGIVARVGLKGQYSFWSRTVQKINSCSISAYFQEIAVNVRNEPITGIVGEEQKKMAFKGGAPSFSLLAAMQIGYETRIKKTGRVGVFAYLDCTFWNTGTDAGGSTTPLISVTPPSGSAYAVVSVNSAFSTAITRINPIQVGVSVYYAIELRAYHRHTRSSSIWEDNTSNTQGKEVK